MAGDIQGAERVLKALANSRRLMIIRYLHAHPRASVGDIAENIKLSFRSTSKHLHILLAADVVEREQQSLVMQYSLQNPLHQLVKTALRFIG
jgi:DNA-binding transcriptional ArsR family regulator